MTLPSLCMAAAAFTAVGADRAAPGHARQTTRAAARPARTRPHRLRSTGGPARFLDAKG